MKHSTIVLIAVIIGGFVFGYGVLQNTVSGNSRMIRRLDAEADKRLEVLQGIDKNQGMITQRLEGLAKRVEKLETE